MTTVRKHKPVRCYQCDAPMTSWMFNDVWDMRIDNKLHKVPVFAVPCHRCVPCDIEVVDGASDEIIHHWYVEYLNANNLNTPYLRFRRWLRAWKNRLVCRYDLWQLRRMKANAGE